MSCVTITRISVDLNTHGKRGWIHGFWATDIFFFFILVGLVQFYIFTSVNWVFLLKSEGWNKGTLKERLIRGRLTLTINTFLIRFAVTMMIIFGGIFTFRYFRTSELLLDQMIGASVGVLLLIASFTWRKKQIMNKVQWKTCFFRKCVFFYF